MAVVELAVSTRSLSDSMAFLPRHGWRAQISSLPRLWGVEYLLSTGKNQLN